MRRTRYVAFLRAVNVGDRIVRMTELKLLFERLGMTEVSTFIASGNVIFSAPDGPLRAGTARARAAQGASLERLIEEGLADGLGFQVPTMVRTASEVSAVATYGAFSPKALAGASLYVGFARARPEPAAVERTLALQTATDELHVAGRELYWLARKSISKASVSMAQLEKALQTTMTFRNVNTVRRLAEKLR